MAFLPDEERTIRKTVRVTGTGALVANVLKVTGAVLSNFTVGAMFLKDKDTTQVYSTLNADQVRVSELLQDNKAGKPFTVVQKNGVDTFLRLHLTTTDNPVDFTVEVVFTYSPLGAGATLEFV